MADNLYFFMISPHGLMRGHDLELGRDADTGGQTLYVVELARALARHPKVERIDVVTRLIEDKDVGADYAEPEEGILVDAEISTRARIVRLPFGPRRYLRKEALWNHLDQLVDRCLAYLRAQPRLPDAIHSHYADAGHVGAQLSQLLDIPLIHTGHSLGRCKRQRLIDHGRKPGTVDRQFQFPRRIEAEESVLEQAELVVTSTAQEITDQYGLYERFHSNRAEVIPPGTDLARFAPPSKVHDSEAVARAIDRFLEQPKKPLVLAIARPEQRKNLRRLIQAFGETPELAERANLAIVAGVRDDLRQMDDEQARVLTDLLLDVDRYDLWGRVALPKQHTSDDVPALYRLAAKRRGVFVNPALTEPFGLTLLEAAASGLPVVATRDGGPVEILARCDNGILVDPLDPLDIGQAILQLICDNARWSQASRRGLAGVAKHYSWDAHVKRYLECVERVQRRVRKQTRRGHVERALAGNVMPRARTLLISDIDNTLLGDDAALERLKARLDARPSSVGFGIATGRHLPSAVEVLAESGVAIPDILITAVGSEIHYGPKLRPDLGWARHIRHRWRRDALAELLTPLPGLELQSSDQQSPVKLSFNIDPELAPSDETIAALLREHRLVAHCIRSHDAYLDILPIRASKGLAIRYLAWKWGLPMTAFLVAGDSGNDLDMLCGDTRAIVVANHAPELEQLAGRELVYFARAGHADGILDGLQHYGESWAQAGDET